MANDRADQAGDGAKKIYLAVDPVRVAAFAALAARAGEAEFSGRLGRLETRIREAQEMLGRGYQSVLKKAGVTLPADIETGRTRSVAALNALAAGFGLEEGGGQRQLPEKQSVLSPLVDTVEETVTVFLTGLDKFSTAQDVARRRDERRALLDAVEEIRRISTSINLISINASIEAARAGDAGRGFGVIANEIQNLSMRSQESLKKILEMSEGN